MPDLPGGPVGPDGRDRALSEVVGYILIFSLIFLTVGFVSLNGLPTLDSAKQSEQTKNAERAFDILENNLAEIYGQGAPSRATEISAETGAVELREPVVMNVSLTENTPDENVTFARSEINPIVFTGLGDTEYVYAGGAVFRQVSDESVMLQEPPIDFGDERGFITVVRTFGDDDLSAGGATVLVRASATRRAVLAADTSLSNNRYKQLTINITGSPRQDNWQEFLESELPDPNTSCTTGGGSLECEVDLDMSGEEVRQTFVTVQEIKIAIEI